MVQIGRIMVDKASVVKVVRDAKAETTTLFGLGSNGLVKIAEFSKHWESAWQTFKR